MVKTKELLGQMKNRQHFYFCIQRKKVLWVWIRNKMRVSKRMNMKWIEVDKSYFTIEYLANVLCSEFFAHLNPIFVAADHHRRKVRHPVCPLWVNWAEVRFVSCWKSFKPGEVTSASPSSLECCCLENRVVGLTLSVGKIVQRVCRWERLCYRCNKEYLQVRCV